jgi:hypothetical protein
MILTMLVTDKDGKQLKRERIDVTSNQLNRLTAPEFHGEVAYRVKKHGEAKVELADGAIIEYKLFKEYSKFLDYWAKTKKLTNLEAEEIKKTLAKAGFTDEQIAEFLTKPIAEINKEIDQIQEANENLAST